MSRAYHAALQVILWDFKPPNQMYKKKTSFIIKIINPETQLDVIIVQGRKAELELLQKQGKESPEELQYKQHYAWLW